MSEQRHMLKMSRHLFSYLMLLLLFLLLICFGSTAVHAQEGNKPKEIQMPETVDIFVPHRTIVETRGKDQLGESFISPSLVSAGGVLVALAKSHTSFPSSGEEQFFAYYADVVAGYIDSAKNWSSFVDEVRLNKWKAYNIFHTTIPKGHDFPVRRAYRPTTVAKGNKVFLLVGDYFTKHYTLTRRDATHLQGLDLLVGEATQDKVIQWGKPTSLLSQIEPSAKQRGLDQFVSAGGSGVVMDDGTLVFPVMARNKVKQLFLSMIIYSKDDGKNWTLSQGMVPAQLRDFLIVEWEQGQLVMVVQRDSLSNVFESRDMGETWTEAVRTLTRVQPRFLPNSLRTAVGVGSLTTATIAGKKVMLYTQKGILRDDPLQATALYLWVADNNRTFHVGPISMDIGDNRTSNNTLLYSNDALHLLQQRVGTTTISLALSSLTDQLKTITSVLETWAKMDSFLSNSSVPTAGLVGFLSDASGDGSWNDAYRCLNAIVRNAKKVENGFKFTGFGSYAMWPVNMRKYHNVHSFVNYAFTLVATVRIDEVPKESVPLLGAGLEDNENTKFVGLSYTTEKRWGTVFNGITTITHNSTWEPGKKYKVALMLQDNKGSVYVDGVLVGNTNKLPTREALRHDITHFYFGGTESSSVTIKNVFLYNQPLNAMKLKKVDSAKASRKRTVDSSKASRKRTVDSSKASGNRTVDSSKASGNRTVDSSKASRKRTVDSSKASGNRTVDSSKASGNRTVDSSKASGNRTVDSSKASGKRTVDSSKASGKRTVDSSKASGKRTVDSSNAVGKLAGDGSTRADVSQLLLLLLGLWSFAALC
ncbi:group II trans-sialidase superfamily [Trypanosoma rangeli]|uniref:Group II trans-sialidase superfamily n=1 Tax=Trypanosoma rangeli TaxID=5698 RepID=A0A3R7N757_TRYRA|nr:group II trans-sialidase superfamily [Trypanosoma rangeli]RNE97714.1 group II trans-sialidase superfamily [Trypanosoma rangeli]|eukprot:RNE97714.1 group II trans-sialidase superfamily [Trypanosoma rangeli]